MKALIDQYTDEEFTNIVNHSFSFKEVSNKLGYKAFSGDSSVKIKKRVDSLKLSTDHFNPMNRRPIKRTEENIFCKDSTASQKTLRQWYKKGEYTPYVCSICGQEPIWQGKDLTLILDHINGENHDDRLENLRWVCPNCNQQLDTTNGKNKKEHSKKYYCIDCGKEVSSKQTKRCISCLAKANTIPVEDLPVTREELKQMIRTIPFTKIGERYNCSDNNIRKWCDKFNLPRKKSDINSYSDKEWDLI